LLEEALHETTGVISGTVRVATIYSVGLHLLPQYIKSFIKQYPQANFLKCDVDAAKAVSSKYKVTAM